MNWFVVLVAIGGAWGCKNDAGDPASIECPSGTRMVTRKQTHEMNVRFRASDDPDARVEQARVSIRPETTRHVCVRSNGREHGPVVELHSNGKVALRGQFRDGRKHGRWLEWLDDGSFSSERNYVDGKGEGRWLDTNLDGLVVESILVGDHVVDTRVLAPRTSMPEWKDGKLDAGTKYRDHRAPPAPSDGFITIPFTPSEDCPGGEYLIDGILSGDYPVERHPVRPGTMQIDIRSGSGHCAGYGRRSVTVRAGQELVLPPDSFDR